MDEFNGRNSVKQPDKTKTCNNCQKEGFVYYTGSSVTHGNIYTPAADSEVGFYYQCDNCGHQWTEYA